MRFIEERYGEDEVEFLFDRGPKAILAGTEGRMSAEEPTPRWELARGFWPKLGLSLVITAGFVGLAPTRRVEAQAEQRSAAPRGWLELRPLLRTVSTMHFVRAARWSLLLAPVQRVPLGTVVRVALVGYLAIALLPFRMGEAARPMLIRRDAKVNAWAATGTVGAERLIDGLTVSVLLLAGLRIARPMDASSRPHRRPPSPGEHHPEPRLRNRVDVRRRIVAMGLFYLRPASAERLTLAVVGPVSKRFARWLATRLADTASGLGFSHRAPLLDPLSFRDARLLALEREFVVGARARLRARTIGYFHALAVMCVVALGIVVPATPGFYGAFQLAIYARACHVSAPGTVRESGALLRLLGYVLPIGLTVAYGAIAALLRPTTTKVGPEDGSRLAAE